MKKLSLYVFLAFMFCNVGLAKEFKSKLGFYLELPLTWKVIDNQNIKELGESEVVDEEAFGALLELAEAEGINPNALYIFPTYAPSVPAYCK